MGADAQNFYRNTTMTRKEYMWVLTSLLPESVISAYPLSALIVNKHVLFQISKDMHGLPQAGHLAYRPVPRTPGLWPPHGSRPVTFCLVVDDFGVKHAGKHHAKHHLNAIQTKYALTCNWAGTLYCGITLN